MSATESATAANRGRSPGQLIGDLARNTGDLVRSEVELVRAELSEKTDNAIKGVAAIVGAAVVLLAGLGVLLDAVVYGLSEVMPPDLVPWLPALLVGGALAIIGILLFIAGREKLKPEALAPTRTVRSLERDRQMVKDQM